MLGKPISESSALCIPTAMYGHPWVGPGEKAWQFISGREPSCPMCELGWKSLGVLELTALPSIDDERWVPVVKRMDHPFDHGNPAFVVDAGERGQFQHSQGLPAQLAHRAARFSSADELPRLLAGTDPGVPVHRGGDAEGAGLADRFAQHVDQRVADARVLDAGGREKKLQVASRIL